MKIDVPQESPKKVDSEESIHESSAGAEKKNYYRGGGPIGGGVERGEGEHAREEDAIIHRNLGESSCEDTTFSPYSSSKCSSGSNDGGERYAPVLQGFRDPVHSRDSAIPSTCSSD